MQDALVPLCRCSGLIQAQAIRGSLEARGVPTLIDGEHQHNVLGMFGSMIDLRIMVPRSQLRLAYELAREVIPDLPEPEFDEDLELARGLESPPHRRAMPEDLVPYPDEDDEGQDDDDDDDSHDFAQLNEDEDDLAEMRERKSLIGPRIGVAVGVLFCAVQIASQQTVIGVIGLCIIAALVYSRVIPITAGPPANP
ncbi:putative signal transducing protein [Enhygromyxa salina]|uniref:DUF2007 domain-containing protein n=1 Tax=Enhygromyxa salina TaxID=215803 RepID=A0A2S9YMI2_9BACT|nr:DUF2007 domain-containing protein [Enhygromyxa salina]PRQ06287.1 hypothetical protein ENSA7_39640 [Enhygromyxa salina]